MENIKNAIEKKIADFNSLDKRKKAIVLVISAVILSVLIGIYFFISVRYQYNDFKHASFVIPKNVKYCIEFKEPSALADRFQKSSFGSEILSSTAWANFLANTELRKLMSYFYFVETRTASVFTLETIGSFIDRYAAYAKMMDGSMLLVVDTNLKSSTGAMLASAFKSDAEKITLTESDISTENGKADKTKNGDNDSQHTGSPSEENGGPANIYGDVYPEKRFKMSNITVTKISVSDGSLYLALLGKTLFMSDSLDTIKASLRLASKIDSNSVMSIEGTKASFESLKSGGLLIYCNLTNSALKDVFSSITPGELAFVFDSSSGNLTAEVFSLGVKYSEKKESAQAFDFPVPLGTQSLFFYCDNFSVDSAVKNYMSLDDKEYKVLKESLSSFLKNSGISYEKTFKGKSGAFASFVGFEKLDGKLYPAGAMAFRTNGRDDSLMKSIFDVSSSTKENQQYQGKEYISYSSEDKFYKPCVFEEKGFTVISNGTAAIEDFISAENGNRPVLHDSESVKLLGEFAGSPNQLIIDMNKCITSLSDYYYYGATKTEEYTSLTIDRDILPLFAPLKKFGTVHVAFGKDALHTGRIVVTDIKD